MALAELIRGRKADCCGPEAAQACKTGELIPANKFSNFALIPGAVMASLVGGSDDFNPCDPAGYDPGCDKLPDPQPARSSNDENGCDERAAAPGSGGLPIIPDPACAGFYNQDR